MENVILGYMHSGGEFPSDLIILYKKGSEIFARSSFFEEAKVFQPEKILGGANFMEAEPNTLLKKDSIAFAFSALEVILGTPKEVSLILEEKLREPGLDADSRERIFDYLITEPRKGHYSA